MSHAIDGFVHRYVPAQDANTPTLLLLHGTGGNEHDLIGVGQALYPGAGMLSPRGQVLENGMSRFFRRLREGVFDLDDLRRRTHELAAFVAGASETYGFDAQRVIGVGYSNGANIAASLLLLRPEVLAGSILFHPRVPIVPEPLPNLNGVPVFVAAGRFDPLVSVGQTDDLVRLLAQARADVQLHWENNGHGLNQQEVAAATTWLHTASFERQETNLS